MIVDDEWIQRSVLTKIIGDNFKEIKIIEEAMNGIEAVRKAKELYPDIVLMDIDMPVMNGIEASRQIKEQCKRCEIIFLTAYETFEYAKQAVKLGAKDYLVKPVMDEDIIEIISRTLEKLSGERKEQFKLIELLDYIKQYKECFEEQLICSIVGGYIEEVNIEEYLYKLKMNIQEGVFCIIDMHQAIKHSEVKKIVKEVFQEWDIINFTYVNKEQIYILILSEEKIAVSILEKIVQQIKYELKQKGIEQVSFGVGESVGVLKELNKTCYQAQSVLGDESKDFYYQIQGIGNLFNEKELLEKQNQLYNSLIESDLRTSINIMVNFIDELEKNNRPLAIIREMIYNIINMLIQYIYLDMNINFIEDNRLEEDVKMIKSTFGLVIYIKEFLRNLINQIESIKINKVGKLVQDIEGYIETNYMKELSLQEIAKAMNFSTFYFSKLFKQYFNKNFREYIIDIRLEKAKEMIRNTELTIKEIGINIGYGDPNYFTKIFRKKIGITPSEYRNRLNYLK